MQYGYFDDAHREYVVQRPDTPAPCVNYLGSPEYGAISSNNAGGYSFAKEGWKALKTLADAALHFETSRIYPGIPEYFSADGRGMYHYLTGAASWFMLTMITEVFGVRGEAGDLVLDPKLTAEQFDETGTAELRLVFAGRPLSVRYRNARHKDYGAYTLAAARCGTQALVRNADGRMVLPRAVVEALPVEGGVITADLV